MTASTYFHVFGNVLFCLLILTLCYLVVDLATYSVLFLAKVGYCI